MLKNDCQQNLMMFPRCYYLNMIGLKRKFFQPEIDNAADKRYLTPYVNFERIKFKKYNSGPHLDDH